MQIPGYQIESKLGQGGMAEVYLAVQESLDRKVALKITSAWQSQDPAFKERFMQEGRIVATLNHPNIVTIHEIGQVDEQYFIAMEYVAGKSLSEKIEEGMTLEESVQTVKRIARALAYAHNGGFLHRDIKPSNILFRDDEYAVLADFGIARALVEDDTRLTQTGMSPGSPAYMSPEQVNGLNLDARSDQYSLGIVFFEMLTGDRPYKGNSATATAILHLTAPVPQLPHPYESLQPIFDRMLAKTPEERFVDEEALIKALDEPDSIEPRSPAENDKHAATMLRSTQARMEKTRVASTIAQQPKGVESSQWLRWGGAAALGVALLGGAMLWLQPDGSVQDDPQDSIAALAADEANIATTQETDSKKAQADSTNTEESVDPQTADAESTSGQMPGLNGQQSISPELQESVESQQADAQPQPQPQPQPKVTPMPGLNGRQSNSPVIKKPDDSQVAETEAAQEPDVKETQPDSSATQKLTDTPAVDVDMEAVQSSEISAEQAGSFEPEEPVDAQVANAPMEAGNEQEKGPDTQELKKAEADPLQDLNQDEGHANMLAMARDQMAAERYMEPAGDNAFETYTDVLAEDADNETAMQGLTQIAEYYEQQARVKQKMGELEQSLALLDLGLKAAPKNSNLIALNNEVTVQYEKQQTQQQIDSLMQKAESQMSGQLLARPQGNNAYETYQAVLALDAGHQPAQKGIQEIANRYQKFAQNKGKAGDLKAGLAMADRGLEVAPEHAGLLALRKEITTQMDGQRETEAKQQTTQAEIQRLLAVAQQQLNADQLTQPKGENARESYNAVLKMAPQNRQARTGLNAVSQRYEVLVREKQSAGDTAAAFTLVKKGLQAFSKHPGLRALHDEIESQLEAAKQVQTTRIEPQPVAKTPKKKKSGARVFGTF